ncbi:hydroxymethylglutaryl-CoA lyase [Penaeicola halotolerans]|uniref:hydroxymethylglutaryl-CoA lyase n=1 Tax=Penaeicola halotolerans TaxID=2793196 RepID=UPI001CF8A1DE|nr:hydroxymethylglutaryl-CoA lyase [Penaeicola halotolerans]
MQLIECPRDAMQGLTEFIPTNTKIAYLNQLLKVGFHSIDFGSFVSPKAIPQLRDTEEVLAGLDLSETKSSLLAIVANTRGAEQAATHKVIQYLGFPLSISETFQQRNTNKSIAEAFVQLEEIQHICLKHNKTLVTYISMGFGNPYGEPFSAEIVGEFVASLEKMGVKIVSLSDTIGSSNPDLISAIFKDNIEAYPNITFGAHLHSTPHTIAEKVIAAYEAGCRRFDGAIRGFGGCPMAKDDLVGNMATEVMVATLEDQFGLSLGLDKKALGEAMLLSNSVFPLH